MAKLKSLATEKIKMLELILKEKEFQYSSITQRNEYLQKEIELTRAEIEAEKQHMMTKASYLELERAKIAQTDLYYSLEDANTITEMQIKGIEDFYRENNPQFMDSICSLCKFTKDEWVVTLLIRMGFSQQQIAQIMCKVPSAIHKIRKKIITRVKGSDAKVEEWNRIVESL